MTATKACRLAANNLIQAFKLVAPDLGPGTRNPDVDLASYAGPSGRHYFTRAGFSKSIERALDQLQPFAGTYPAEALSKKLVNLVIRLKDVCTPIETVHSAVVESLGQMLVELHTLGTWALLQAVRGIQVQDNPFTVGNVEFVRISRETYWLWGQRFACGDWNPSSDTPVPRTWLESHQSILGQAVALICVPACDADHARYEVQQRIVESLDLIRYGQVTVGWPKEPVPELGLSALGHVHHQSFVVRRDKPSFETAIEIGPGEGAVLDYCRIAPAWNQLEEIICAERTSRTELQRRVVLALSWAGQAALARSSAVRLVSFMTALETLLIAETESIGKRSKLQQRIPAFPQTPFSNVKVTAEHVDELYRLRSNCLHAGVAIVPEPKVQLASVALAQVINGLLTNERFHRLGSLEEVLKELPTATTSTLPFAYSI